MREIRLTSPGDAKIDPAVIVALHERHAEELRCFVLGVVRDHHLAAEVVQAAFTKVVELGHTVRRESLKSWLFRVAFNEALSVRRRQGVGERVLRTLGDQSPKYSTPPENRVLRDETVAAVREALQALPPDQYRVVFLRMYEQKKFIEIAAELDVPLGTVLSRMQLAMAKLKRSLAIHGDGESK